MISHRGCIAFWPDDLYRRIKPQSHHNVSIPFCVRLSMAGSPPLEPFAKNATFACATPHPVVWVSRHSPTAQQGLTGPAVLVGLPIFGWWASRPGWICLPILGKQKNLPLQRSFAATTPLTSSLPLSHVYSPSASSDRPPASQENSITQCTPLILIASSYTLYLSTRTNAYKIVDDSDV